LGNAIPNRESLIPLTETQQDLYINIQYNMMQLFTKSIFEY